MALEELVLKLRETLLSGVEEAARNGNASTIVGLGAKLQRVERVESQIQRLLEEIHSLSASNLAMEGGPNPDPAQGGIEPRRANSSRSDQRLRAKQRKAHVIEELAMKGIQLSPRHGAIYTDQQGKRAGIAYAYEGLSSNSWFLGLPIDGFDCAILVCEARDGRVLTFLLPDVLLQDHLASLTHARGQTKFHVSYRDADWFLDVPGKRPIRIPPSVPWGLKA